MLNVRFRVLYMTLEKKVLKKLAKNFFIPKKGSTFVLSKGNKYLGKLKITNCK